MNVSSALWRVKTLNASMAAIIQRASGTVRYVHPSTLPGVNEMAMMHELRFNKILREAFHDAATH